MEDRTPKGHLLAVLLILAGLSLASQAPAIFLGRIPAQTDWLLNYGPWGARPWLKETAPPHNPGGGDDFFVYLPDRLTALNEWRAGHLPLWNPYVSGGAPLLGMQTANPLDPLIGLELILPPGPGMGLAYAILLFVAALGVVLFLRDHGVTESGPLVIAGITFALNPFFVVWLQDRVFLAGLAPLPLALWALERVQLRGAAEKREAAVLALALGYAALGGTLQTTALFLLILAVRSAWLLVVAGRDTVPVRVTGRYLLPAAVAAGLAIGALPLLAGIEALAHSTRLGSNGYYTLSNHLSWRTVALWFNLGAFHLPRDGEFAALADYQRRFMSGSGFGHLGVIPLGLALLALLRRAGPARERWFWGGLAGTTLVFLFLQATPVHASLVRLMPWLNDIDLLRGLFVVNLAGALLAGRGAAALAELWASATSRRAWLVPWLGYLAAGVVALAIGRVGLRAAPELGPVLLPFLLSAGAVLVLGLAAPGRAGWRGPTSLLLAGLVAFELLRLHFALNTFAPRDTLYPPHPYVTAVRQFTREELHSRFMVEGALRVLPPNTGSVYGLSDVRSYSVIPIARYRLLIECAENRTNLRNLPALGRLDSPIYRLLTVDQIVAMDPFSNPLFENVANSQSRRRRASLGRAFLVHDVARVRDEGEMRSRLMDPQFDPGLLVYLEEAAGPLPPMTPPERAEGVHIVAYEPARVSIEATASAPGMLVLSDAYYPGWRATLDGQTTKIFPADWGVRGVAVPPGFHRVVFEYRPAWLLPGFLATLAGVIFALAMAVPVGARYSAAPIKSRPAR